MHRAALPQRRLLVADRRQQGMREAQAGIVELDDPLPHSRFERSEHSLSISVSWRRPAPPSAARAPRPEAGRRRLGRQLGEAAAEQLAQALRYSQRLTGRGPRVRANQLASELEREERVTGCCLLHATELGRVTAPGRAAASSRLCVALRLSGPTESCCRRPSAKARSSSKGLAASGVFRRVARSPTRSALSRRSAIWITPAEAGSSHCRSSRATTTGPRSLRAHRTSSTPSPIACGSGGTSPGSASRSATSSARLLGGTSACAASSNTGAISSERPAKESDASASTPRQTRARPNRFLASSTPASQRIVLPIPASPGEHQRRRALLDLGQEPLDRAELLVAPDDLRGHRDQTSAVSSTAARRAASPARRTPSLR